jgi:SAM-dependent methyltransferase
MLKKALKHYRQGTLFLALANRFKKTMFRDTEKNGIAFQLKRNTQAKADIILSVLKQKQVNSVLDVGCNAGEVTRRMGEAGFFAVGVDKKLDFRGVKKPLEKACLGQVECNLNLVNNLPQFDAILLLSVHHQMIKFLGDNWARQFVSSLAKKAKKLLFIEFSVLNDKYGKIDGDLFIDNDEKSVLAYAFGWLKLTLPEFDISYMGSIPQVKKEPNRMLFKCENK